MMQKRLVSGSFYGETLRKRQVGGLYLVESAYAPDSRLPMHAHENAFFYVVLDGSCLEHYERRTRTSHAAALVFHPSGASHANYWQTGGHCFHIELAPVWIQRLSEHAPVLERPADFSGGAPVWLARRLYHEFQMQDTAASLAMEGLTWEILAEMSRLSPSPARPKRPHWLMQARDLLHDQFAETFSLNALAQAVGVHPAYLCRAFRHHFGCSPGDYLRQIRIEYACRQIAAGALSLGEIALEAGFADQSHFSRTFKSRMGMTPAAYQKIFRVGQ